MTQHMPALTDFKALTFDCYGTLIDWESGMIEALRPLTDQLETAWSRDAILEAHASAESTQQRWTPAMKYSELLAVVYKRLAEQWKLTVTAEQCQAYGQSVRHWPAFDDSAEALSYLSDHYQLIILSNVDNESFQASNNKLKVRFDAVYTAEDIGSYKPSGRNFDYLIEHLPALDLKKNDILHTAESLFHDHVPAKKLGLHNCWIYRRYAQDGFGATVDPGIVPDIDFRFHSMAELAEAHQQGLLTA